MFQLNLLKYCTGNGVPHIATVSTSNEAYNAWKTRLPIIKLFPTKSMGQVEYVEDLLQKKSMIKLFVKVDKDWRLKNISQYGY